MDTVSVERRSEIMSRVRHRDTGPEMAVRRLVHSMGYRFRLHGRGLPGKPDLVLRSHSKVIFVHGCFWHRHKDCALARVPKSRLEFWRTKLEGNRVRDEHAVRALKADGWRVLTVWECELASTEKVARRVQRFLNAKR